MVHWTGCGKKETAKRIINKQIKICNECESKSSAISNDGMNEYYESRKANITNGCANSNNIESSNNMI